MAVKDTVSRQRHSAQRDRSADRGNDGDVSVVSNVDGDLVQITARDGAMSEFKVQLLEQIGRELREIPDEQLRSSDAESVEDAAHRFVASRRVDNEWDEAIGPFYDTAGLTRWLNEKHRMNLQHQIDRGEILAVKAGRTRLYPSFQFSPSGQPLPGLGRVLAVLAAGIADPWDQALWLNSPLDGEGGQTAALLLQQGNNDRVLQMARKDVAQWTQ